MACHLFSAKPLNWCWLIINWTLRNKLLCNVNGNLSIFIQEIVFKNVICKMVAWSQYVNSLFPRFRNSNTSMVLTVCPTWPPLRSWTKPSPRRHGARLPPHRRRLLAVIRKTQERKMRRKREKGRKRRKEKRRRNLQRWGIHRWLSARLCQATSHYLNQCWWRSPYGVVWLGHNEKMALLPRLLSKLRTIGLF